MYIFALWFVKTILGVRAARIKYRIFAPVMSGNPDFDRVIRVQANFVEQFPSFITAMFLCTLFEGGTVAAALGAVWVVCRAAHGERYSARKLGHGATELPIHHEFNSHVIKSLLSLVNAK
ncbi:unnamed protein product [Closterium sp. NIES-65]|nr:unnamed protein product [Closterium sp. NIES-65]